MTRAERGLMIRLLAFIGATTGHDPIGFTDESVWGRWFTREEWVEVNKLNEAADRVPIPR